MTDTLDLIQKIVDAEPFVLNDAIVERVLNLLAEAVVETGRDGTIVRVPGLGTLEAIEHEGPLKFRLHIDP